MRSLRIQDTLTGELRQLEPREGKRVGIYACGPTVYGPVHVGNARPYVVFSLLKRFLEHEGYEVTFVANVTDVNDKIYDAAAREGVPSAELARAMTERYEQDTGRLGLGRPDREPKASETIGEIVALIQALIDGGHAYATGGDVYFRVASFEGYGKLSNRSLEDMDQGEDDDVPGSTAVKESPHDFALWKAHKEGEDTAWDAPWGRGRPGWHIECSAMAEAILGLDFEIHGGGSDLVFPHHENEIAQTEAARDRPLARLWMHNGMVRLGEKMAKSVGNVRLLSDALDELGAEALVMYFVGGHYRQPIAYSDDALEQARASVARVRELGRRLDPAAGDPEGASAHEQRFYDALADDFNTPAALAAVFGWVADANRALDAGQAVGPGALRDMLWCLGLDSLIAGGDAAPDDDALRLLDEREAARAERDFATADARRDELADRGWQVRDTPEGPKLVPAEG